MRKSREEIAIILCISAETVKMSGKGVSVKAAFADPVQDSWLMGRLLMILQEAVGNAIRHGDATKVLAKVVFGAKDLTMTIVDNGVGFDASTIAEDHGHYGIRGMTTRAREGGGTFKIDSTPGNGTTVIVTFPT